MAVLTWARKRQIFYILVLISVVIVFGLLIAAPKFKKEPTCFDRKMNGTEEGIDCGGSCALACVSGIEDVGVLWSRAFKILPGRYNATAVVENYNKDAVVKKIDYRFRFADENNVYVGSRTGSTLIPPGTRFAVFEPGIDIGNSVPVYTNFEFTEHPTWLSVPEQLSNLRILVSEIVLSDEETSPRLSAKVRNPSLQIIPNVTVVAILYDASGNAISSSRTYIEELKRGEMKEVVFTWPEKFSSKVVTKEILPLFDVFSVKLK